MLRPTVVILSGIPTSGKSTWAELYSLTSNAFYPKDFRNPYILCRDSIRLEKFEKYSDIKFNKKLEDEVTETFNLRLNVAIDLSKNIVIDQTNCSEKYLKALLKRFENTNYIVKIKFFDIPLWKAYYRNIKRRIKTGKWIPIKVIKKMKNNYDKINKKDYDHYKY